ncbi:MAG TPA: sigma-70 family RNA polymerase sigma factor [Actinomycetota bacterium]|nr:sigma-70 family RNA polymerase sigma factor [Actinomycetota bacterium]
MVSTRGILPFQWFLEAHGPVVYRFLHALVGPNEVDDCFQETFLAALRAYPNLRSSENLRGWILTIAGRKAIDTSRSKRRRPMPLPDVTQFDLEASNGHVELIDTDEPLWKAVRALPDRQRVALVLRVLLDRSYTELAAVMGCSVQTARANVYQALKRLRGANLDERMKTE